MFDATCAINKAKLLTIGYEGASAEDFIATLKYKNVAILIDVRELPLSRKKGFSKNRLRELLEAEGIEYLHIKQLGDPKPGRVAARAGDFSEFRRIFGEHIGLQKTREALQNILPLIEAGGACLLCFERCHSQCHRSIVAEELAKMGNIDLVHIGVDKGLAKQN